MTNVNYGISTKKGGMDPLMKKIYIGAALGLLFMICAGYGCSWACSGPSIVKTSFKCQHIDKKTGKQCPGKRTVEHPKDQPASAPNCVDDHGPMKEE